MIYGGCFYQYHVPTGLWRGGHAFFYQYHVPTGLWGGGYAFFYQYHVPTGLNYCYYFLVILPRWRTKARGG